MDPHIRGQRSRRTPIALAMATLLVLLAPNAASAAMPGWLDPQAGWHGRAIERPEPHSTTTSQAAAAGRTVSAGDGLSTAKGSQAVRRVQGILHELGYGTGPIDGRFGQRTRSAVAWFQVKHGLTVDGIAGPQTVQRLRERERAPAGSDTTHAEQPPAAAVPDADAQAPRAAGPGPANPGAADASEPSDRWLAAAIAVGLVLIATLIGLLLRRRRRTAEGTVVSLAQPLWVAGTSTDPAIGRFSGTAAALHVSPPTTRTDTPPAIRYCVIDEESGAPVWVSPQDIHESRGLDDRQRRLAADAPVQRPAAAPGRRFSRAGARPRRGGSVGRPQPRPAGASHVERRVTWFRSLGMPPEAIADLLTDEEVPPPRGHSAWTSEAVAEVGDGGDQAPAAVGRPAQAGGPIDDREGRSN